MTAATAWRSGAWQQHLYNNYLAYKAGGPWAPQAAKPGTSLHEKGIAVDIQGVDPSNTNYNAKRAAWLVSNAAKFKFYNTGAFFKNKEPWHWAYGVQREGGVVVA
jgi:LAS superfamily LD-carboxypeptidase LdcB